MSQYLGTIQVGNNPKPTVEIYLDSYRREGTSVFAYFSYRLLALGGYDRWGYDVILNWSFKLAGENPWNGHSITVQPINQWQWGEKWGSFSIENFDTGTYNACALNFNFNLSSQAGSGTGFDYVLSYGAEYTSPIAGFVSATNIDGYFSNTTISWSGFQHGLNNGIKEYEVWYLESSDNNNWSERIKIRNVYTSETYGQTDWSGGQEGKYYKFGVVALGTVDGTYSDINVYTGSFRKAFSPTAPALAFDKAVISQSGSVLLSWYGASANSGILSRLEIEANYFDGVSWSGYKPIQQIQNPSINGFVTQKPKDYTAFGYNGKPKVKSRFIYRVRVINSFGMYSAYKESGILEVSGVRKYQYGYNGKWIPVKVKYGYNGKWIPVVLKRGEGGKWVICGKV
jgi:hypothetical protein